MVTLPDYFFPRIKEIARLTNGSEVQLAGLCRYSMEMCRKEGKSKKLAATETYELLLKDIPAQEHECIEVWQ